MVEIVKLPTRLKVYCPQCQRRKTVHVYLPSGKAPRFRCSRCGNTNPIVIGREPLRQWARYRR